VAVAGDPLWSTLRHGSGDVFANDLRMPFRQSVALALVFFTGKTRVKPPKWHKPCIIKEINLRINFALSAKLDIEQ
jgi:hypothetical protein